MELTPRANPHVRLNSDRAVATVVTPAKSLGTLLALAWRTPILALVLAAVAYGTFVDNRLADHNWDWSYFVTAGNNPAILVDHTQLPIAVYIGDNSGYDGQYYFRLALEPMSRDWDAYGIHLDNAPYRQERILYPALAWAVALGHWRFIPAALVLVNVLGLCALAWLAGSLAQTAGRNPLWGLAVVLYPGFLLALSRDLVEIVEMTFFVATLLALRRNWAPAAAISLTLAILARETAGLLVATLAVTWIVDRVRKRVPAFPAYVFVAPAAVALGWQVFLYRRWHALPLLSGQDKYASPLSALTQFIGSIPFADGDAKLLWSIELYLLAVMLVLGLVLVAGSSARLYEKLAWLGYTVLGLSFSANIWVDDWSFMRVLIEWYVLGVVVLLGARWRDTGPLVAVTSAAAGLWIMLFTRLT
jgi:hypothetical protein